MTPDFINALFECLGGLFVALSVHQLWRDNQARGVHWGTVLFFSSWGYWNLYYYPSLGQIWSGAGAIGVALVNTSWLALLWRYRKN